MAASFEAEMIAHCSEAPPGVSCSESMSNLSSGYTHTIYQKAALYHIRCMATQGEYEASMGRLSLGAALKGS